MGAFVVYKALRSDVLRLKDKPFVSAVQSTRVTLPGTRRATVGTEGLSFMNPVTRHLIYHYLLTECLSLSIDHRKDIEKHWGEVPELCVSVPSVQRKSIIVPALAEVFDYDLTGVPGFYYDYKREYPCHWRLNLPDKIKGIMRPYFDENNLIVGLFIYADVVDANPHLLSSKGLTLGTEAIKPSKQSNRGVAA